MPQDTPVVPTPTPAPTTPSAPVPAPSPSPTPEPSPSPSSEPFDSPFKEVFDRAEAHLKKIDGEPKPKPETSPKPEPKAEVPKAEPKKTPDKPKSEPHKLRDELDARTAELTSLKESHGKLESKLRELESKGQDTEKVLARIKQIEKERDDIAKERESLSAKLKVVKLEEDPEFQREHDQKFNRAAGLAKDFVEKLDVLGPAGQDADGNPIAPSPIRKADWNRDFVKLYHQFKDAPVMAFAEMKRLFGEDAAGLVLPKIQGLIEMERDREDKLSESRARAKEMQAQEEAQAATRRQQFESIWASTNKDLQERSPEFKIDPTDSELVQIRDESLKIFDGKPVNDQQRIIKNAYIRQMVGQFAVQKMLLARVNKRVAELTAENESLKNPTPGPAKRSSGGSTATEPDEDWASRAKRELV